MYINIQKVEQSRRTRSVDNLFSKCLQLKLVVNFCIEFQFRSNDLNFSLSSKKFLIKIRIFYADVGLRVGFLLEKRKFF